MKLLRDETPCIENEFLYRPTSFYVTVNLHYCDHQGVVKYTSFILKGSVIFKIVRSNFASYILLHFEQNKLNNYYRNPHFKFSASKLCRL